MIEKILERKFRSKVSSVQETFARIQIHLKQTWSSSWTSDDGGRSKQWHREQALTIKIMELIKNNMMTDRSTVCCRVAARRASAEGGAARVCVLVWWEIRVLVWICWEMLFLRISLYFPYQCMMNHSRHDRWDTCCAATRYIPPWCSPSHRSL